MKRFHYSANAKRYRAILRLLIITTILFTLSSWKVLFKLISLIPGVANLNVTSERTFEPNVILVMKGDLGSRLRSLCASRMLTEVAGLRLNVIWKSDKWLPATHYSDLFVKNEKFSVLQSEAKVPHSWPTWMQKVEAYVEHCHDATGKEIVIPDLPEWKKTIIPPRTLYVDAEISVCTLRSASLKLGLNSKVQKLMSQCYQSLSVSPEVLQLLDSFDLERLQNSVGVLVQSGEPIEPFQILDTEATASKTGIGYGGWLQSIMRDNAKVREAAKKELTLQFKSLKLRVSNRSRESNITGKEEGSMALNAKVSPPRRRLHGVRASSVWFESRKGKQSEEDSEAEEDENSAFYSLDSKAKSMANTVRDENDDLHNILSAGASANGNRCRGGTGNWKYDAGQFLLAIVNEFLASKNALVLVGGRPLQSVDLIFDKVHPKANLERIGFLTDDLEEVCRGSSLSPSGIPSWTRKQALFAGQAERQPLVACARRQLAELVALSYSKSLIYMFPSGEAEFILSRAKQYSAADFSTRRPLCASPPMQPFKKQRWTQFIDIDEKSGLLYCAMPKVACTAYRRWIRKIKGLPDLQQPEDIHKRGVNGLTVLHFHYTESQIVNLLTNPGIFRFTFVRNPWNRILSAYLDKHVLGGVVERNRHKWNKRFFRKLGREAIPGIDTDGYIPFPKFVRKTGAMIEKHRNATDEHIAPQIDMCVLDRMRYDFVGRFERLGNDTVELGAQLRLRGWNASLPDLGKVVHSTKAEDKILSYFDSDTVNLVRRVYSMDVNFPLNGVHFAPPVVLRPEKVWKPIN